MGWIKYAYHGYIALQRVDRGGAGAAPAAADLLQPDARGPQARVIPNQPPEHPPSPVDILRDKRAMLDTGTGPIAFVVVYAIWGLKTAAIVAIALGVVMAIERVVRKKTVVNVARRAVRDRDLGGDRLAHRQGRDLLRAARADPGRLRDRLRGLGG